MRPDSYAGRNLHFGVREHVMGASVNGLVVSGVRAFGATFFNFSDYMRASIRLAALMEIPSIFIFTHDSIGLGEDGPTHQPIEQLAGLRAMPNLVVLRPGDANEVVEAWKIIAQLQHQPVALVSDPSGDCRLLTARSTARPPAQREELIFWPMRRAANRK